MALLKKVTNESGIIANYHRIKAIETDGVNMRVKICSYADDTYRLKEKSLVDIFDRIQEQMSLIDELGRTEISSEEDAEKLRKANEKLEALHKEAEDYDKIYCIFESEVTLPVEEEKDISFQSIYATLKTMEPFTGAFDA